MMLALLLAQLVLPWPGLDSPLVQPGPTICVGECAGPVVWGPAERGRLVVACDMRSDTCSDGRTITTTRSTPVPCEVSPGVWEMVPEDTGCYSVRGLESWAQNTSYLSYGAELDREPWRSAGQATLEKLDGFYRLSGPVGSNVVQTVGDATEQTTYTFACILRGNGQARLNFGGPQVMSLSPEWRQYSRTASIPAGGVIAPRIYTGDGSSTSDPVDIMGCWLTRTSTPGRPCWGGEAPVTCGGEVSEISTAGWPTTHGSIEIEFRIDEAPQDFAIILDGRSSATVGFNIHYARATGRLNHRQGDRVMEGPTITLGTWYRVRLEREGGDARMYVNGVLGAAESDWPAWSYPYKSGVALLGRYTVAAQFYVNGSISSLTVRSYEEVSP